MPIKVLHVITGMGSGGAEMMIMNWYRNIDRSKVQFDFLLRSRENIYADEIEKLGGKVYYTAEYPRHYLKNLSETLAFFKEHASEYSAIHVHCNALLYVNGFDIAKKYGIKTRIIHSHNTKAKNRIYGIVHKLNRGRVRRVATHFMACSSDAGKWAFNDKIKYDVLTNGIDAAKYSFNSDARERMRHDLGLGDSFVIGHVGRFLDVKNHKFLVDVFERMARKNDRAELVLVGTGPLEEEIKQIVADKGLSDRVHFLGVRKDVHELYSAFDCFAFPSKYEGMPVALLEAQTSGLPCIVSSAVSVDSVVTNFVKMLPIDDADVWAEKIYKTEPHCRENSWKQVESSGFGIASSTEKLQKCYLSEDDND